jgi:hypothetical protein
MNSIRVNEWTSERGQQVAVIAREARPKQSGNCQLMKLVYLFSNKKIN